MIIPWLFPWLVGGAVGALATCMWRLTTYAARGLRFAEAACYALVVALIVGLAVHLSLPEMLSHHPVPDDPLGLAIYRMYHLALPVMFLGSIWARLHLLKGVR